MAELEQCGWLWLGFLHTTLDGTAFPCRDAVALVGLSMTQSPTNLLTCQQLQAPILDLRFLEFSPECRYSGYGRWGAAAVVCFVNDVIDKGCLNPWPARASSWWPCRLTGCNNLDIEAAARSWHGP